jgi:hypothetical protein
MMLRGELQRVQHTQDLVETATDVGRVGDDQFDPLGRRDDEDAAHGHGLAQVVPVSEGGLVEHAEEHRHPAFLVRDDREVHVVCWVSLMSAIQRPWSSVPSTLKPMTLALRALHSGASLAVVPNSVVHTA